MTTRDAALYALRPRKLSRLDDDNNNDDDDDAYSSCRSPDDTSEEASMHGAAASSSAATTTMADCVDDTTTTSINAIFAVTGPRAGVLHARSGHDALRVLQPHINAAVYDVLAQAWQHVAMPAEAYWGSRCYAYAATTDAMHTLQSTHTNGNDNNDNDGSTHGDATAASAALLLRQQQQQQHSTHRVRVPDATRLSSSFYGSRSEAMASRGYARARGDVVVAVDRHGGHGSKLYNVLPRRTLDAFVAAIPRLHNRNVYVLIDEEAAVDPFFDIDCTYTYTDNNNDTSNNNNGSDGDVLCGALPPWLSRGATHSSDAVARDVEAMLLTVLQWARAQFEERLRTTLRDCVVFTSSVQVWQRIADNGSSGGGDATQSSNSSCRAARLIELKVSVHVHLRLAQRRAFASVSELHAFMSRLRSDCDAVLRDMHTTTTSATATTTQQAQQADKRDDVEDSHVATATMAAAAQTASSVLPDVHTARVVRSCVDGGVYTRWRAFRLPYNVKCPLTSQTTATTTMTSSYTSLCEQAQLTAVEAAADDLLFAQLRELGVSAPPCVEVGAVAPSLLTTLLLDAAATRYAAQYALLRRLFYGYRFLLPVVPRCTQLHNAQLRAFLLRYDAQRSHDDDDEDDNVTSRSEAGDVPTPSSLSSLPARLSARAVSLLFDYACVQRDAVATSSSSSSSLTTPLPLHLLSASDDVTLAAAAAVNVVDDNNDDEAHTTTAVADARRNDDDGGDAGDGGGDGSRLSSSSLPRSTVVAAVVATVAAAAAVAAAHVDPFALATPPRPRSVRVPLHDVQVKRLLLDVFACLSPHYGACNDAGVALLPAHDDKSNAEDDDTMQSAAAAAAAVAAAPPLYADQLHVYYEEALRAYYVMQKQSRYCLRLRRRHRSTYAQLYLTYGSIKVRCYANDCCSEKCVMVPWRQPATNDGGVRHGTSNDAVQSASSRSMTGVRGYPAYARLQQLHARLFPPLSTEELVRRYGVSALRAA